jgi:hypothetical protein
VIVRDRGGALMEQQTTLTKMRYQAPKITRLEADDVLRMFQMTAAQISAAGCWWQTKVHSGT